MSQFEKISTRILSKPTIPAKEWDIRKLEFFPQEKVMEDVMLRACPYCECKMLRRNDVDESIADPFAVRTSMNITRNSRRILYRKINTVDRFLAWVRNKPYYHTIIHYTTEFHCMICGARFTINRYDALYKVPRFARTFKGEQSDMLIALEDIPDKDSWSLPCV